MRVSLVGVQTLLLLILGASWLSLLHIRYMMYALLAIIRIPAAVIPVKWDVKRV